MSEILDYNVTVYLAALECHKRATDQLKSTPIIPKMVKTELGKCLQDLNNFILEHSLTTECRDRIIELRQDLKNKMQHLNSLFLPYGSIENNIETALTFPFNKNSVIASTEAINFIEEMPSTSPSENQAVFSSKSHSNKRDSFNRKTLNLEDFLLQPCVANLSAIAGLEEVKMMLRTQVILPLYQPQLFEGRLRNSNCILLYGPPGTGKTRLVHGLAGELGVGLYFISAADILGSFVGESERKIKQIFNALINLEGNSIMLIDEIDGLFRIRNDSESDCGRRVKNEFLSQLTRFEANKGKFLICTTNCPWDIDPAFLRRFHERLYLPLPARAERHSLLKYFAECSNLENVLQNCNYGQLLDLTEGYSGSDLAQVMQTANDIPIMELETAKVWCRTPSGKFAAVDQCRKEEGVVNGDILQLPRNSVTVRPVIEKDILRAIKKVEKTVKKSYLQKLDQFHNS